MTKVALGGRADLASRLAHCASARGVEARRPRWLRFRYKAKATIALAGGAVLVLLAQSISIDSRPPAAISSAPAVAQSRGASVPFHFEPNQGQTGATARYLTRGPGYLMFLTPAGAVMKLAEALPEPDAGDRRHRMRHFGRGVRSRAAAARRSAAVRISFDGANPSPAIEGLDPLAGRVNYFVGNDPTKWRTAIPTYGRVRYREVWPRIDVVFYAAGGALEYDLIVAPRANPAAIRLKVEGAGAQLERNGDLVLKTAIGDLRLCRLRLYQDSPGGARRAIDGKFALLPNRGAANIIGVQVASYDRSRPLLIDPQIVYATYLGGSGGTSKAGLAVGDEATAIAIDPLDDVYLTGLAFSTDFPTTVGLGDPGASGDTEVAFVAKLNPAMAGAASLVFSTYLGGSGNPNAQPEGIERRPGQRDRSRQLRRRVCNRLHLFRRFPYHPRRLPALESDSRREL